MDHEPHFCERELIEYCADHLKALGVPHEDAHTVARCLVASDARGVSSHGVALLVAYTEQLKQGGLNPRPIISVVRDHAATALLDGDAGMGQVIATQAMKLAIDKAGEFGTGMVAVRNSHHFGAAGHYALMALEHGMIGIASSTAGVTMTVRGASRRVIGNNPLAIAAPGGGEPPILFDTAMSAVSGGRIVRMAGTKESIPEGWLVDKFGNDTTDPRDFIRGGALLPFGGHKGFGLALAVEVLSGVLAGAALTTDIKMWRDDPDQPSGVGHLFVAISIDSFRSTEEFRGDVDRLLQRLASDLDAEPSDQSIRIPGAGSHRRTQATAMTGVSVPADVHESLQRIGRELGVGFPYPLRD